jgi:hypothetical protein
MGVVQNQVNPFTIKRETVLGKTNQVPLVPFPAGKTHRTLFSMDGKPSCITQ